MITRPDNGIFYSYQQLSKYVIQNSALFLPKETFLSLFQKVESTFIQISTSPSTAFEFLASEMLCSLLISTDSEYHKQLVSSLIQMEDVLFVEKSLRRAEKFKSKIILRNCYLISMFLALSSADCRHFIFTKLG